VAVFGSMYARITQGNTAVNSVLQMGLFVDGVLDPHPNPGLMAQNAGIGQAGSVANVWAPSLPAGEHTVQLVMWWNGTAGAAQQFSASICALV
jgi:hypothetical protein